MSRASPGAEHWQPLSAVSESASDMTRRIALFRGLNVGGKNAVSMKNLIGILERLGCRNVRTYIQSGNVVFDEPAGREVSSASIAAALKADTGIDSSVLMLTAAELREAANGNPFAAEEARTVHLFFLDTAPDNPDLDALQRLSKDSERWQLSGAVFYLHAPEGIARSRLAAAVERKLGVGATARNWRTAGKVLALAETA